MRRGVEFAIMAIILTAISFALAPHIVKFVDSIWSELD